MALRTLNLFIWSICLSVLCAPCEGASFSLRALGGAAVISTCLSAVIAIGGGTEIKETTGASNEGEVRKVLADYCVDCHDDKRRDGGVGSALDLKTVRARYVSPGDPRATISLSPPSMPEGVTLLHRTCRRS